MGTTAAKLIAWVMPTTTPTGLTDTQARILRFGRSQALVWGQRWGFTGIYPEAHRDGAAEPARQRGALAR